MYRKPRVIVTYAMIITTIWMALFRNESRTCLKINKITCTNFSGVMEVEVLLIPQSNKFLGCKSILMCENIEKGVGRVGSKVEIQFNSKVISRRHASFLLKHQRLYLRDTGSSSGTFVNHSRLSAIGKESDFVEIKDGDLIQCNN